MLNWRVELLQSFWTVPNFRSRGEMVRQVAAIAALSETVPSGLPGLLMLKETRPVAFGTAAGTITWGQARTGMVRVAPGWSSLSNSAPAGSEKITSVGALRSRFESRHTSPAFWLLFLMVNERSA